MTQKSKHTETNRATRALPNREHWMLADVRRGLYLLLGFFNGALRDAEVRYLCHGRRESSRR